MNYGTAYGREPKVWKLGREALALTECDKLDEGESNDQLRVAGLRGPYG